MKRFILALLIVSQVAVIAQACDQCGGDHERPERITPDRETK